MDIEKLERLHQIALTPNPGQSIEYIITWCPYNKIIRPQHMLAGNQPDFTNCQFRGFVVIATNCMKAHTLALGSQWPPYLVLNGTCQWPIRITVYHIPLERCGATECEKLNMVSNWICVTLSGKLWSVCWRVSQMADPINLTARNFITRELYYKMLSSSHNV